MKDKVRPDVNDIIRKMNNKFVAPPTARVLELEEGCPNFGGGNQTRMIPEENGPRTVGDWIDDLEEAPSLVEPEPMPTKNELPYMWPKAIDRIIEIARQRDDFGAKKYGTRLQPFNGRDPLVDAFQEGLDKLVYIEQELFERPYKDAVIEAAIAFATNSDPWLNTTLTTKLRQAVDSLLDVKGSKPKQFD